MMNQDYNIDFERIKELISKYEQIKNSGEIRKYKEEDTKKDFILPLFEALGWNVYNRANKNDSISAEETISKKRVDYGFRINGIPKFFLEAKSLKEDNIHNNPNYVTQAIDYAWMKSCSWAILTNFETIAVYNADWKGQSFGYNHLFTFHPTDFLTNPKFKLLSKKAFENDEIDKIALEYGKKPFKNPIDKQLLLDMIHFREILSKNILKNNQDKHLTQDDIDESVQRILDRLIFIRNAEDRGLEENRLLSNVRQWSQKGKGNLIKEISSVYKYYDDQYNSKLFARHLCDDLYIDNEALQEVIEGLNHSKDNSYRYDFSIIESDVLGNIYEQYLGNILKSTPKRAKLEEAKTHRKEQGIYYTPSYIVDYIVRNTVGEYIKTHTPEEIKKVRILDPACGSGSFLIRAYKELENYWKQNSDFAQLTLDSEEFYSKKVEILKNNIFGVDLDPKAVEIAQLNLLLQISEKGERLPLLQNNVKVGNSLIDDLSVSDKAFKWEEELPEIMKEGGFDIIIGNPPYFNIKSEDVLKNLSYFKNLSNGVVNSATLFLKKSLDLLKKGGTLGFIIPKSFAYVDSWKPIRKIIYENTQLLKLVDVSKAFKDVLLEQIIIVVEKQNPNMDKAVSLISEFYMPTQSLTKISYGEIIKNDMIAFQSNPLEMSIYNKLNTGVIFLGKISKNFRGIGVQKLVSKEYKDGERIFCGREIQRYYTSDDCNYFIGKDYISKIDKAKKLRVPKIMVQNIVAHIKDHIKITATYDSEGVLDLDTVNNIVVEDVNFNPKYILALLNSNLISFYAYNFIYSKAIRTMHFDSGYSDKIPVKQVSEKVQVYLASKVDSLLNLYREYLSKIKYSDKVIKLKEEIDRLEKEINDNVYEIYGINDDERNLIEENSK